MTEFIPHQFEKLKAELLGVSGIKQIIPSDCKLLSVQIYAKTHRQVSETTLKRVFGFAYSEFKPSAFTVSAIAQYCGYSGWNDFTQQFRQPAMHTTAKSNWDAVNDQAKKITGFTLQTLKSRSGIPYAQTISRKFLKEHLDIFTQEPYTATILSAPSGYGKTTALCHWADEKMRSNNHNDIVLFFNCNILTGALAGHSLNNCLLTMLGVQVDSNIFDTDFFEHVQPKGTFYLIIDELNDGNYKRNDFYCQFSQLIDVVSLYRNHSWFKVVLSMRSVTWVNNRHFLANKMNNWFMGFMHDHQQGVNVPLFNGQEIALLDNKIAPQNNTVIDDTHIYSLAHPLYFQYYYQLHQQRFLLDEVSNASLYELTTEHAARKIYNGKFNDDKIVLLRKLIDKLEHAFGECYIDKLKVNDLLKNYYPAYQDLLSDGVLKYTSADNALKYEKHIKFADHNLLEFTVADKLLADNGQQFDSQLILRLNNLPHLKKHKIYILKWLLYHMISVHQINNLQWLSAGGLSAMEEAELMLFVSQLLKKAAA